MSIKFREFFDHCRFFFLMEGDSNWDYYLMQYLDDTPSVVAIAKNGSGCNDSFFGDIPYFRNYLRRKGICFNLGQRLSELAQDGAMV